MPTHRIATREQWLAERLKLLEAEKDLTHRSDELVRRRQELPWVKIDKKYRFDTEEGSATLAHLFKGRSQLLVYHFMFGPDYTAGCPSCSAIADGFNGFAVHLANHDVMLWAISRAPLAKLQAFRQRMGWIFPWASSFDSDFNWDFAMSLTDEQQREGGAEYNYRPQPAYTPPKGSGPNIGAQVTGTYPTTYARERPGMSAFVLEDGTVYHSLFRLCAWCRRSLGRLPMARSRPQRPQRAHLLVAPPRQIPKGLKRLALNPIRPSPHSEEWSDEAIRQCGRRTVDLKNTSPTVKDSSDRVNRVHGLPAKLPACRSDYSSIRGPLPALLSDRAWPPRARTVAPKATFARSPRSYLMGE